MAPWSFEVIGRMAQALPRARSGGTCRPRAGYEAAVRDLRRLAAAAGLAAGLSLGALARAEPLHGAFGDGRAYEAMARGAPGAPPFNRRVLMAALARRAGFAPVAVAGLAGSAATAGLLAARVARELGARGAAARDAGLLVAALVPLAPHGARLARQVPAFNDGLAGALGGLWLLAVTAEETGGSAARPRRAVARALRPAARGRLRAARPARAAAPAALLLAALTREQWLVVAPAVRAPRRAELAAGTVALATVAAQPAAPGSEVYPPREALRRLRTPDGLAEHAWALTFVLGALPALLPAAVRARRRSPTARALLRAAAVQGALALVGGSDTPRLLHGALLPLLPALVGTAAAAAGARPPRRPAPVLAATVAGWRPLTAIEPTLEGYERFFLPYMQRDLARRSAADLLRRVAAAATAAALSCAWRGPGRPR